MSRGKTSDLPAGLAQPAQRALAGAGILSIEQLAAFSEAEIRQLHGIGPNALEKLRRTLADKGLAFRQLEKIERKASKTTRMNTKPKIETRQAHPYAAIRMQVRIPFGKFLQPAWSQVHDWLAKQGLSHGPAIIRYLTTDMSKELDIDVGFAIDQAIAGGDGITTGILPAGQYATLLYTGPYKGKGVFKANVAIIDWANENGIAWKMSHHDGAEWWDARVEWYLSDPDVEPDPKKYQTELAFMVADTR